MYETRSHCFQFLVAGNQRPTIKYISLSEIYLDIISVNTIIIEYLRYLEHNFCCELPESTTKIMLFLNLALL